MEPSNKTRLWILGASHLAMVAIGLLLARPHSSDTEDSAETTQGASNNSTTAAATSSSQKGISRQGSTFKPSTSWHGGEYARAWKALPHAKLSTPDRIRIQRELLEKWAETDLAGAIDAALAEAWDDDDGAYYSASGQLLSALSKAFGKDPERSWDMIRDRQFGVATGMLRHEWIRAMGQTTPLFLASKMGEFSWRDADDVSNALFMDIAPGSESAKALYAAIAKLPPETVSAEMLLDAAQRTGVEVDLQGIEQEVLGLIGKDDRMAKVRATQWGWKLGTQPAGEVEAQVLALPEALRKDVTWAAFTGSTPETRLGIATLLVDQMAWDKLESGEIVSLLQITARQGKAKELADWATELPVRKETTELFHRTVDPYLRDNMDGAREWLATLPEGTWRDRAYAEYSQQALNAHNNPEASRWALDQIGDTTFKTEAESWRSNWEKRTGWQAQ